MSMGSSSPPKHTQRMKMNWHVLDCLPHQVDHILDCLPHQVDHVHVKRGGNHTCGSQPEQCGFKGVVLLLGFKVLELHTCGSQPEQCGFKGVVLLLLGFKVLELVVQSHLRFTARAVRL